MTGISRLQDAQLGAELASLRSRNGHVTALLAAAIGVSAARYGAFESGDERIPARQLYRFSHHCNVPTTYFFDGFREALEDEEPSSPINRKDLVSS